LRRSRSAGRWTYSFGGVEFIAPLTPGLLFKTTKTGAPKKTEVIQLGAQRRVRGGPNLLI